MPTYVHFCDDCGERAEEFRPIARFKRFPKCPKCGQKMPIDIAAQGRTAGTPPPGAWPMECWASAVDVSQVKEARAKLAARGVECDFKITGREASPIYRDRQHRAKCLRAFGLHDRNAGYSDPAKP